MKTLIYPLIEIIDTPKFFELRTNLRKEEDGIWYDMLHVSKHDKHDDIEFTCENKIDLINRFHSLIYSSIVLGKVNTDIKNGNGKGLFRESERQYSESERLKENLCL